MLDAGLPLVQASGCNRAAASESRSSRRSWNRSGATSRPEPRFRHAMARHPKVFDSLFTNMVAAGETGGILDTILQRLCTFIEKIVKLKRALRSAMIYPATILTIAVGVVAIILWKVVPVFSTLFEGFNVELPLLTRIVITLSRPVERYCLFFVILVGIAASSGSGVVLQNR